MRLSSEHATRVARAGRRVAGFAGVFWAVVGALAAYVETSTFEYELVADGARGYARTVFAADESPEFHVRLIGRGRAETPSAAALQARVFDFWGEEAGAVRVEPDVSPAAVVLRPNVRGPGWFRLELTPREASAGFRLRRRVEDPLALESFNYLQFAVVPRPHSRTEVPDSPFGVDMAIGRHVGTAWKAALFELADWSGCRWVRERLDWAEVNPDPQTLQWEPYRSVVHEFSRRGFNVLETIENSPAWARANGNRSFPTNLAAAYDFARQAGSVMGRDVKAWEVWNEEDIAHFAKDPPDQYASFLKAMALGFKHAAQPPLVNLGPFARHPDVGGYADVLLANDVAPYVDAYGFHTYHPHEGQLFDRVLATHRAVATRLGFGDKPLWLTETGRVYARRTGNDISEAPDGQVNYVVRAYVTALAKNIGPVFGFIMRPHFEPAVQFGLVDSTLCPFPVYAALAVMTNQLGRAEYLGPVSLAKGEAHLFRNGSATTVVVFSATKGVLQLPPVAQDARAFDVMGQPIGLETNGGNTSAAMRGFPIYIRNSGWGTTSRPSENPPAAELRPSRGRELGKIVLRFHFPIENVALDTARTEEYWDGVASNWAPRGYTFQPGEQLDASVEVYNFSEVEQSGELNLQAPSGFVCEPERVMVRVAAQKMVTVKFALRTPKPADPQPVIISCRGTFPGDAIATVAAQWIARPN